MDELVFQRESLRRALLALAEQLENAGEAYDPEADLPAEDLAVALRTDGLRVQISGYVNAIAHRIKARAGIEDT